MKILETIAGIVYNKYLKPDLDWLADSLKDERTEFITATHSRLQRLEKHAQQLSKHINRLDTSE